MNHKAPQDRRPYGERVWLVIGLTFAVLMAIGGLALVGATVVTFVLISRLGSNK